jgi:hypothetical protein
MSASAFARVFHRGECELPVRLLPGDANPEQ